MNKETDNLAIAHALIERFGAEAIRIGEARACAHLRAEEIEGAEFWQGIADRVRMLLSGYSWLPRRYLPVRSTR
jgi:collagenase-like PrtC family protease